MISLLARYIKKCKPNNDISVNTESYTLDRDQLITGQLAEAAKHLYSPWLGFTSRQIDTARTKFACKMTDSEQIILFQDCSALQRGTIGLIVTDTAIYTSYLPTPKIPLHQIKGYHAEGPTYPVLTIGTMPSLFINNQCAMYSCQDYELFDRVMTLLRQK